MQTLARRPSRPAVAVAARRTLAACLLACTLPVSVAVAADGDARSDRASAPTFAALMEAAEIDRQTAAVSRQAIGGVRTAIEEAVRERELPVAHVKIADAAAHHAFGAAVMTDTVRAGIAEALEPGDAEALLPHFRSPLGRRMTEAELTRTLEDGAAFAAFVQAFATRADRDERLERFAEMEASLHFAERTAGMMLDMQKATVAGVVLASPAHARDGLDEHLAALDAQRGPMAGMMREPMVQALAYLYDEFTLDEVDTMLAWYATPSAQRLNEGVWNGLSEAMALGGLAFGDRMTSRVRLAEGVERI